MEAEVVEQMALEEPRGRVGDLAAAEVRMHGEAAEVRDPAADVAALEAHRPGPLAVDLDDEDAERVGLGVRAVDLGEELLESLRAHRGEERLDVLVRHELGEEVGVVRSRSPDRDVHGQACP